MINKNIKVLSIFLILTVFIIGAASTVSAAKPTTIAQLEDSDVPVANITQGTASATESTDIEGTIVTGIAATGDGNYVPQGTVVDLNGKITLDSGVYTTDDNGDYVTITGLSVTQDTAIAETNEGVFTAKITIANVTSDTLYLENEGTYYLKASIAATTATADASTADVNASDVYVPFIYIQKEIISLTSTKGSANYGANNWAITGKAVDNEGNPIEVTLTVDDPNLTKTFTPTNTDGTFKIDNTTDASLNNLGAGTHKFTISTSLGYEETYTLTIKPISIDVDATINATSVYFGEKATVTIVLSQNATEALTFVVTPYDYKENQAGTPAQVTIAKDKTNGTVEITFDTVSGYSADNYYYTVELSGALTDNNYKYGEDTIYNVEVKTVPTSISVKDDVYYVSDGTDTNENSVIIVDNNNEGVDGGAITGVIRDTNGILKYTLQSTDVTDKRDGNYTINLDDKTSDILAIGNYTITFNFALANYEDATITIPLVVKKGLVITSSENPTYDYATKSVNVTIALEDTEGNPLSANITAKLVLLNDDDEVETETNIAIVNGKAVYDFGALNLDEGTYNYKVVYDGDATYNPAEVEITVTVNPIAELGTLKINETSVKYNTNDDTTSVTITLYDYTNSSKINPYNGLVSYTSDNGATVYNLTMTNGVAVVPINTLEGLTATNDGNPTTNTVLFKIEGNNQSTTASLDVVVTALDGAIITDKTISANNNTLITIEGVVENATMGTVTITIKDNKTKTITYATIDNVQVAEDGSFSTTSGALANGVYEVEITYNNDGDIKLVASTLKTAKSILTVNGSSTPGPEPTPTNVTYNTVLVIDDFTETVGAGKSLTGRLLTEDGTPVVGMHIQLTLTRTSTGDSKTYTTTTDYNGEFQFPINLAVGNYTAKATFEGVTIPSTNVTYEASESEETPFYVLPENGTDPNSTNETDVIITPTPYVGTYGSPDYFVVKFTDSEGNPLVGYPIGTIEITLTRLSNGASKTYSYFVTDYKGETQMLIELGAGEYSAHILFTGSTVPAVHGTATADSTITVNA